MRSIVNRPLAGPPAPPPPPRVPRPSTRRHGPREYTIERLPNHVRRVPRTEQPPPGVDALIDAGRTGSTLRRRLKERDIDPKLARLVLLFYRDIPIRPAEVAWALNVSPSTASRWLDRAERAGLVDKLYLDLDRRGTWARLTTRGVQLRRRVERELDAISSNERPRGVVYGIRGSMRPREWRAQPQRASSASRSSGLTTASVA